LPEGGGGRVAGTQSDYQSHGEMTNSPLTRRLRAARRQRWCVERRRGRGRRLL